MAFLFRAAFLASLFLAACDSGGGSGPGDSASDASEPGRDAQGDAFGLADAQPAASDAAIVGNQTDAASDAAAVAADGGQDGADGSVLTDGSLDAGGPVACAVPLPSGPALFDLDTSSPVKVAATDTRLLAKDTAGHWVLWDAATGSRVATGDGPANTPLRVALQGDVALIQADQTLEVRAATDGHLLGTIPFARRTCCLTPDPGGAFGIAPDGSYVWTATMTDISTWSLAGAQLATRTGNYQSDTVVFATSTALLVGGGPAGASLLERIAADSGASTTSSFLGTFVAFFGDGSKFLTLTGTTARVYSAEAVQLRLMALPAGASGLGGYGDYFWSRSPFAVYQVNGDDQPLPIPALGPADTVIASRQLLGVLSSAGTGYSIDLSEATPAATPLVATKGQANFAATPNGTRVVTDANGVIFEQRSTETVWRKLGCGGVIDLTVSPDGIFAISVGAGEVLVGDLDKRTLQYVIPVSASRVVITDDAATLAVSDDDVRLFGLAGGTLNPEAAPSDASGGKLFDFDLSRSGTRLLELRCITGAPTRFCTSRVTSPDGSETFSFTSTSVYDGYPSAVLSPSGVGLAIGSSTPMSHEDSTNIYQDGVLVGAVAGSPVGWVDENRLLVQTFQTQSVLAASSIVDRSGALISTTPVPILHPPARFYRQGTLVFDPVDNKMYELSSGAKVWSGSFSSAIRTSAATESQIVYVSGSQLLVTSY